MLQNRASEDSRAIVNSLQKRDVPWRCTSKVMLSGCLWPHPYSGVGLHISRNPEFPQPLHKAVAAVGRAGCPAMEIKPWASAHRGLESIPGLHSTLFAFVL